MNKQAEENQRRGRKVLQIISSPSRAVLQGQCVFMPGVLLKMSQNKNEESGEGWRFPKEILPDLDSSFLWSIMSAGGSITFLPRLAFHSADYSMTFPADKAENRPHFENLSARVESVDG